MSTVINPICFAVAKCEDCKDQFCVVVLEKDNPNPAVLKDYKHGELNSMISKANEYNEWLNLKKQQVNNIASSVYHLNKEIKLFGVDDPKEKGKLHQCRM